jgi:hypothetical protein
MIYLHPSDARQHEIADTLSKLTLAELKRRKSGPRGKSSGTQRALRRKNAF